jgi:Spy/CpxP family protein refolding chaperone
MKKAVVIGLVVALGIGLGGLALANYGGHGGGGGMMGPGYGAGLGACKGGDQTSQLTPEQTKQLEQLRLKHWEATKGLQADLFAKHQERRGLLIRSNPDQKAIDKLEKEIFSVRQKLQEKNFAFRQEMHQIAPQFRNCENRGGGKGEQGERRRGPRFDQGRGCH